MRRLLGILFTCALVGCGGSSSGSSGNGGAGGGGGTGGITNPPESLASGLSISEVAIYQGLKVPLMVGGALVDPRPLPVVQGRDALLRVFVQPDPTWQPREVIVRLDLFNSAGQLAPQEIRRVVNGPSAEGDFMSAFNFDISGAQITGDVGYSVGVYEVAPSGVPGSTGARWPVEGAVALNAQSSGPSLKMVMVPVQYDTDGSGRLPDTSEPQLELYRQIMFKLYPVAAVEIRVREPMPWSQTVSRSGQGWGNLLQNLLFNRQKDVGNGAALDQEYYYGLVSPAASFFQYCQGGCVAGLSSGSVKASDSYVRGSVGLGYSGEQSANTFVHETGHAHGRLHAPCAPFGQISGVDPGFPYGDASIGSWGYDLVNHQLIDPAGGSRDMMSYCEPSWISDYTYNALFERIGFVNAGADIITTAVAPASYQVISVAADGELALGHEVSLRSPPGGNPRELEITGSGGAKRRVTGYFYPYDHIAGGMVLVPKLAPTDRVLRLDSKQLGL